MIRRTQHLFKRYALMHGRIEETGSALFDSAGKLVGHIDRISISADQLLVEGWVLSRRVGLANGTQTAECKPALRRDDVLGMNADSGIETPGFALRLPNSLGHTILWFEIDGVRYVQPLPMVTQRHLRKMRRAQIGPFLRQSARALPAALHWLVTRDPRAAQRVNAMLGLTAPALPARQLVEQIFADDPGAKAGLMQTGITIIVPVYNAFNLLPEVLNRVLRHTDLPWRMIVVEDCSSDPQVRPWLGKWHAALAADMQDRVTLIENETNLGFIRSVNRAFAAALPFGDHVVLLNSDALVPAGWASRLIRPLLDHDNVATVTPMSNDAEIFNIPVICQREDLHRGEADQIDRIAAQFASDAVLADAPTGVGFCMAMHIDMLRKIPELDTGFGRGYGEEVDWCQRARAAGGRHLGFGGLFVEHRGGTSFGSAEKTALIQKNSATIARRYPEYDAEVQDFIRSDPLNTPRLALALAWAGIRQNGALPVYIAHDMGGGAEHYLQNRLKSDLDQGVGAVVLRVGGQSRWKIELHSANGITRGETDSTDLLGRLLGLLPARRIIYSCAAGDSDLISLPDILTAWAQGDHDRIEVLIHDYLLLSPAYTLIGTDGAYHGVPPLDSTDPVHMTRRPDGSPVDLGEWRAAWGGLLIAADAIHVFSDNSRDLMTAAYPQVADKLVVTPHRLLHDVPQVEPGAREDGVPVIGILGNIGYQKGIGVLRDLSQLLVQTGQARLAIIGNTDPNYPLAASAEVHGDYRIEDIPTLVARYGISCWLIPSIGPETFSYTTHEALATGLPVFSFDLGAQGDAVRRAAAHSGQGGIIPLTGTEADLTAILDTVL